MASHGFQRFIGVFMATGVLGAIAIFLLSEQDSAAPQSRAVASVAVPAIEPPPITEPGRSPATSPADATPGGASARAKSRPRSRMARDLEREQIWASLARKHELPPAAPGSAAPTPEAAAALPSLDPQYIKSAIAEQLLPVMVECYESALADDPALAGKLVAEFTIVGAEEVGGIVEDASISDESTLDSAFVRECVRESLLAVTFEPPSDGGRVQVTYPFEFAPDGPPNE